MQALLARLLLGIGLAGAVGGPYILILAFTQPGTYRKPELAKKQGLTAALVGIVLLGIGYLLLR
jgi:amino acid permease